MLLDGQLGSLRIGKNGFVRPYVRRPKLNKRTLEVIEQSSGQSWIGSDRLRRALAGDFDPRAHTALLAKDTRLAIDAAHAVGFDTVVGESGNRLSGGQRQRVALARTLLREASILVLDEATSQLDRATEQVVLRGLRALRHDEGRTLIVVAHRLATIADADQIVVMDAGRIVEVGTHQELVEADGAYALLLARQMPEETVLLP